MIYRLKIIIEMVIKLIIWMWNLINTEVIKKELVCNYISSFFIMKVSKLKSIDIENLMYLNQDIERCHNLVSEKKGDFTMIYGYARVSTKGQAKD